jgi:hypothetical protein
MIKRQYSMMRDDESLDGNVEGRMTRAITAMMKRQCDDS